MTDYSFVVGGDFNAILDPNLDSSNALRSREQGLATAALRTWTRSLGLVDIWRSVNPMVQDFSFFSARHKSFSRIDYLFISPHLFHKIVHTSLLPIALSDHKGVICSAEFKKGCNRATRWRFNTSLLKNKDFITQFINEFEEFVTFNVGSVEDHRILWDAIKGFIRSFTIRFSSHLSKTRAIRLQSMEVEFQRLDSELQHNYSEQGALNRDLIKKEINDLLKQQSEFQIHRTRQRYYFQGARPPGYEN